MELKKHHLDSFYITVPYAYHMQNKEVLLNFISNSPDKFLTNNDSYFTDNISKYDWEESTNFSREWVKYFLTNFDKQLGNITNVLGYNDFSIQDMWFQQYTQGSTHGWHTHGCNFTGVYYLEMSSTAPVTELISPWNHKSFIPDVTEGDVIIFPSYVIHRAPKVSTEERKTIISFNFNMRNPSPGFLDYLNKICP